MLLLLVTLALAEANPEVAPTEVVLDDGQILRGMIERQEDGSIVVTLGSGTMLRFPSAAIREVRPATPPPPPVVCPEPTAVATTPPPAGGDLPLPTDHPG